MQIINRDSFSHATVMFSLIIDQIFADDTEFINDVAYRPMFTSGVPRYACAFDYFWLLRDMHVHCCPP